MFRARAKRCRRIKIIKFHSVSHLLTLRGTHGGIRGAFVKKKRGALRSSLNGRDD